MNPYILLGLVLIAMILFTYFVFIKSNRRYLLKHGIPGTAKVADIQKTMYTVGQSGRRVMKIFLDVEIAGNNYRQVTIKHAFDIGKTMPEIGDSVHILMDLKKDKNVILAGADE